MSKLMLDTNAFTPLFQGKTKVVQKIETFSQIYVSVIVMGELFVGFKNGNAEEKNRRIFADFLSEGRIEVIPVSKDTAEVYMDLLVSLLKKGTPIPTNDVWIAAQAIEYGAQLLTFDKHFKHISGLRMVDLEL